ncbi:MAG: hypothetical protein DRN78_02920 [Thermoproteota archaeon]|nr:MAG: hypothetical protein DRN78_02920 [Candidatus Korarchaeota archaeon]
MQVFFFDPLFEWLFGGAFYELLNLILIIVFLVIMNSWTPRLIFIAAIVLSTFLPFLAIPASFLADMVGFLPEETWNVIFYGLVCKLLFDRSRPVIIIGRYYQYK